jgi:hypothetical protein
MILESVMQDYGSKDPDLDPKEILTDPKPAIKLYS